MRRTGSFIIAMKTNLAWAAVFFSAGAALAEVRLPAIFSDHMVLQSGVAAPIWGWAAPNEKVTASLDGKSAETTADAAGNWRLALPTLPAGGPHTLTVSGANRLEIKDVLIGEVWLGSGQSNMAMTVSRAKDYEAEKKNAELPRLRVFTTARQNTLEPARDCQGVWKVCSAETVGNFSATGFFFARELHRELGEPVGLILSAVGGTPIDSWVDGSLQRALPEMREFFAAQSQEEATFDPVKAKADHEAALEKWKEAAKSARAAGKPPPRRPRDPAELRTRKSNLGGLFNGMIAPLIPYAIRGALWYQGEANTVPAKAGFYQHQLPLLVTDWRRRWGSEFPFAWVQLPNFAGTGRDLPLVREAMLKTLRLPHTGMAVTIDIGETKDIHPKNKQEVGRRLSLWALHSVYERKDVPPAAPLPAGHEIAGGEIRLSFHHAEGLKTRDGGKVTGFQIAAADRRWLPAEARIDGSKVIVSHPQVSQPAAVRYAWENDPVCNLVNAAGLPASPFRTDDWSTQAAEQAAPVRQRAKRKPAP